MPIRHTSRGWWWGSKGPFKSRAKAVQVAQAAYAHGYKKGTNPVDAKPVPGMHSASGRVRRAVKALLRRSY